MEIRKKRFNMSSNTCEWCKTTYPDFDKTEIYYRTIVFGVNHTLCSSCIKSLRIISNNKSKSTQEETP